jgi:hypothetical protein
MESCPWESLESLQSRRAVLGRDIVENRVALQKARERARAVRLRSARSWQLSSVHRETAVILYMLAEYSSAPVVMYLQNLSRRQKWLQQSPATLQAMAEDLFLAAAPERLAELGDLENPAAPVAMKAACLFWVEWGLAAWVGEANQRKGIAPSTAAVLQELERRRLQLPETVRFCSRGGPSENKARVWAHEWRKRWGARLGRVRPRDDISATEMRAKVRMF